MRFVSRIWFALFLILILLSVKANAFYTKQYNTSNSLISNNIYFTLKDKKGYLWFFTDKGVSKFDGDKFIDFTILDGLEDNEIFKAYEDKSGRLWLFTRDGSPCYIYNNEVHNPANDEVLKKLPVMSYMNEIYEDTDSTLYIGYDNGDVLQLDNQEVTWIYNNTDRVQGVTAIYKDANVIKVVLRDTVLYVKNRAVFKINRIPHSVSFAQKDILLLADGEGVKIYKGDELIWRLNDPSINVRMIVRLYLSSKGYLFCCTPKGLIIIDTKSGQRWKLFSNIVITCVAEDINGNFWVSTLHNGIYFVDKNLDDIKLLGDINKYDFTYTKSGQLFFEDKHNAYKLCGENELTIGKINVPVGRWYHPLYLDNDLLFFTFSHFSNSTDYYDRETGKLYKTPVYTKFVLPYGDGSYLLIGIHDICNCKLVDHKLDIVSKIQFGRYRIGMGVMGNDHNFYFLQSAYLYQYNPRTNALMKIDSFTSKQQIVGMVNCGYNLLLKTNNGVVLGYKIPAGIKKTLQNNLLIFDVYRLMNGTSLLYTNDGYYLSGKNNDNDFDYASLKKVQLPFRQKDIVFLYPYDDKIVCNAGGQLYSFDQQLLVSATDTPSLFLKKVMIDGKGYANRKIVLNNIVGCNVKLEFASLYFNNTQSNIRYRIITNGVPGKWYTQPVGELDILLNRWGNFSIEIKAVTENNVESAVQTISLKLNPPFYYTVAFYAVILVLVICLISFVIYIYDKNRKRKFRNELDYLQLENKAINSLLNPHFIFNSINNIMGLINNGSKRNINSYLSTLSKLIRQNMENLQFNFISMSKELELLRNYIYLQNLRFGDRIVLKINDNTQMAEMIQIPPLLIHTFVENAIIHGFARDMAQYEIRVDLDLSSDDYLIIKIKDNGIGFDISKPKALKDKTSLGIDFNRKRLQRLSEFYKVDYTLNISSAGKRERGTEVLIIIYSKFRE